MLSVHAGPISSPIGKALAVRATARIGARRRSATPTAIGIARRSASHRSPSWISLSTKTSKAISTAIAAPSRASKRAGGSADTRA